MSIWVCQNCGFDNERGVRFCGQCGNAMLSGCPICRTEVSSSAEFCENCGVNLREGAKIATWLQQLKNKANDYEFYPSLITGITTGGFNYVFGRCKDILPRVEINLALSPKINLKISEINQQSGEIVASIGSMWSWPKTWTIRVIIQGDTEKSRGIGIVCSQNYPTIGSITNEIAARTMKVLTSSIKLIPVNIA